MTMQPTIERLRELFCYDPETGILVWRVHRGRAAQGATVGWPDQDGYLNCRADGSTLKVHRVAWALMTGFWPEKHIDHRDGQRANNAWLNLREATISDNACNRNHGRFNKLGARGVNRYGKSRYVAHVVRHGKRHRFGPYDTIEAAAAAYRAGVESLHREFARLPSQNAKGRT